MDRINRIDCLPVIGIIVLILICSSTPCTTKSITIRNDTTRKNISRKIIVAHDGYLEFFYRRYYLYGAVRGACF